MAHRITCREIIKPSSPTPSHLQTYHLSLLDQLASPNTVPMVFFYPNYASSTSDEKSRQLKSSLSQTLTKYYPFAGRRTSPKTPYIDCNDEGIVYLEAHNSSTLDDFLHKDKLYDETLDQFFPDHHHASASLVEVQVNHFTCGGVAVAVSMSHKVGDARTLCSFVNYWATVTRCGSLDHEQVLSISPHFISSPPITNTTILPEYVLKESSDLTTKKFRFPNSKLDDLKSKAIGTPNPTRFEVLASLLFKTQVAASAAANNSDCFRPSHLVFPMNLRKNMALPDTAMGNIILTTIATTAQTAKVELNDVIAALRKTKMQFQGIKNVQEAGETARKMYSAIGGEVDLDQFYLCSSVCGFPFYKVDFGWGKPIQVTFKILPTQKISIYLMDSPSGDGIEAIISLGKEDMAIFQNDKDLLKFCS